MFIVPLEGLQSIQSIGGADKVTGAAGGLGAAGGVGEVPMFGDVLKEAIANVRETQAVSAQDSYDLAMGKTDDLHTIQINSLKASSAVELAAGISSRAITAYKEILQTQI